MATMTLDYYDAGLLGDGGGGDVSWWQDYIRSELERAHEFYQSQIDAHLRERETAKAGVTDEMVEYASRIYSDSSPFALQAMREALEAVAPLLSVQVPDVVTLVHAASGLNASERHAWALGWNDCRDAMLAAAPKRGEG